MTAHARAFLQTMADSPRDDREAAILAARGLWVDWPLVELRLLAPGHKLKVRVTSDVFALGTTDEPIRIPLSGPGCQRVADALGMTLITPMLSDLAWQSADVRLVPQPWGPPYGAAMLTVDRLLAHNDRVETLRGGRGGLVAGAKKDVVLAKSMSSHPECVVIYGWHAPHPMPISPTRTLRAGEPIQPVFPGMHTPHGAAHELAYADYSHGLRLAAMECELDGEVVQLPELLASPGFSQLVSNEGPLEVLRYPT